MGDVPASPTSRRGRSEEVYWRSAVEIPSLSLMEIKRVGPRRLDRETSPIVHQIGNREDGSSSECPSPDDPSAGIYVSDNFVESCSDVSDVIFGRHGPSYLPSYFGRDHAPRRPVTLRKNLHLSYFSLHTYSNSDTTHINTSSLYVTAVHFVTCERFSAIRSNAALDGLVTFAVYQRYHRTLLYISPTSNRNLAFVAQLHLD